MNLVLNKKEPRETVRRNARAISQCGCWGTVLESDNSRKSGLNEVDVLLDGGLAIYGVPVASFEWTRNSADGKAALGRRDLPCAGCRVFVMMPSGEFSSAFVLCSGFAFADANAAKPFLDSDKQHLRTAQIPAGDKCWRTDYDVTTGSFSAASPDEKTSAKIEYGENGEAAENPSFSAKVLDEVSISHVSGDDAAIKIDVFGETTLEIKKGESVSISAFGGKAAVEIDKDGNIDLKTEKAITVKSDKDISVECESASVKANKDAKVEAAQNAEIKAASAKITGGKLTVNGTATPSGSGGFCGLPTCAFTGAPHVGNVIMGT